MSEPALEPNPSPPTGDSKTSSPMQEPILQTQAEVQTDFKPKRYKPPQPDSDTFSTRQEFLDSLKPLDIHHVDNDRRRCPICWKPIGEEADPGFDNSELPVKLRCSHVFGHKCLARTYAPPSTTKFRLQPLSFAPGKKGLLLGYNLDTFTRRHGMSPIEVHSSSPMEVVETFQLMVNEACQPLKGLELFGKHWWSIFREVLQCGRNFRFVVLMENATIFELDPHSPREHSALVQSSIHHGSLSLTSVDLDKALVQATDSQFASLVEDQIAIPPAEVAPKPMTISPGPTMIHVSTPPFEIFAQDTQPTVGINEYASSSTWEDVPAAPTNLDKLTALQANKSKMGKESDATGPENMTMAGGSKTSAAVFEANAEKLRRMHEADMKRRQETRMMLAYVLADAWTKYKNATASQPQELTTEDTCSRPVRVSVTFHEEDMMKTSYQIPGPPCFPIDGQESDSGGDENDLQKYSLIVISSFCSLCWKANSEMNLPRLKELTWKDERKTPDSCPLCQKILFRTRPTRLQGP